MSEFFIKEKPFRMQVENLDFSMKLNIYIVIQNLYEWPIADLMISINGTIIGLSNQAFKIFKDNILNVKQISHMKYLITQSLYIMKHTINGCKCIKEEVSIYPLFCIWIAYIKMFISCTNCVCNYDMRQLYTCVKT